MKSLFVLTPATRNDLQDILLDITEDSPAAAERIRSEFCSELQKLGRSPGLGHYHDELLSRKYRSWNFYRCVIAYAREVSPIQVISIVHGARDLAVMFSLRRNRENRRNTLLGFSLYH